MLVLLIHIAYTINVYALGKQKKIPPIGGIFIEVGAKGLEPLTLSV